MRSKVTCSGIFGDGHFLRAYPCGDQYHLFPSSGVRAPAISRGMRRFRPLVRRRKKLRVMSGGALWTNRMSEARLRVFRNVQFNLLPRLVAGPYLFAECTDGQQATQYPKLAFLTGYPINQQSEPYERDHADRQVNTRVQQ